MIRPGVREACRTLAEAGVLLIVVTNQPDLARGTAARPTVDAINDHLAAELGLDAVCVCPHDDADGCDCRKPRPGLLLEAAERHGVDLGAASWWATAGATSRRAPGRASPPCGSAATIPSASRRRPTTSSTVCAAVVTSSWSSLTVEEAPQR